NDYTPALEDYVAHYGGTQLVDEFRRASNERARSESNGQDWYAQTPEHRHSQRPRRNPWWARVTDNTLDVATYHLPQLLYERQDEQGADYSILFPSNVLSPLAARSAEARQVLQRAINHYHADLYRNYSDRLTPVAGIPL